MVGVKLSVVTVSLLASVMFISCASTRSSLSPTRKYPRSQLQSDYDLYREILETHHPSLYWYTTRDSMDNRFREGRSQIKDSMTEPEFRRLLSWVTSAIRCGHTSIRSSRAWVKYSDTARLGRMFPLSMKVWENHMVVTQSLLRRDTIFRRGTEIASINGVPANLIVDSLFQFLSTDGYNTTHKYQALSNRGFFGSLYTSVFGNRPFYDIEWMDSTGKLHHTTIPAYTPVARDTGRAFQRPRQPDVPQPSRRERRKQRQEQVRLLKIDTTTGTALMQLNSFGRGYGLRRFFRDSYATLNRLGIDNLIIDVRTNGGGSVNNSTLASRYIARQKFRLADSLYAIRKGSRYDRHIAAHFWNKLFITFLTSHRKNGYHHFGYFERHKFRPKKKNHYDGNVYILIGGNSFSATTLFTSVLREQDNVTVIGEETGGGAYGNSAWLIPDVTLPQTGVRFRLPLFRLVIDRDLPKNGHGVFPEIYSGPTLAEVKKGSDFKLETAMELIRKQRDRRNPPR